MTRIVAVADLHENLIDIPSCDILLIAGDISYAFKGDLPAKQKFLVGPFKRWCESSPAKHIVVVAGNHDQSIEQWGFPFDTPKVTYLQDSAAEIRSLKIWGTPWQPWFHGWAFNAPMSHGEDFLAMKYENIPPDTDIIVSHGPPFGYGDLTQRGEKVGSRELLYAIDRVQPDLVVCGHIHSDRGDRIRPPGPTIVNASIVNERYEPVHAPFVYDL